MYISALSFSKAYITIVMNIINLEGGSAEPPSSPPPPPPGYGPEWLCQKQTTTKNLHLPPSPNLSDAHSCPHDRPHPPLSPRPPLPVWSAPLPSARWPLYDCSPSHWLHHPPASWLCWALFCGMKGGRDTASSLAMDRQQSVASELNKV